MTTPNISAQLFFLYDSHCPWSYVATKLVNEIHNVFPQITLNLWHTAFFDGKTNDSSRRKVNEIKEVERLANIQFSQNYQQLLLESKNSILSANLMTWAQNKTPDLVLPLLNALQEAHFEQGNQLTSATDFDTIISTLKLSPPAKVFKHDKLSKDAMIQLEEIFALQEIINTQAIPALLLAVEDQLILLNHNFYLSEPKAIIEAVQLELNKYT
ncbi:hypothetical protein NBRC116592_27200 [Colwellia sp. KU-HH00111]|uniref:DsbA family protein n=1 Tax=Colwellia sp. KU-HH00111 TaxID=3127652 RepID=UPI003103F023